MRQAPFFVKKSVLKRLLYIVAFALLALQPLCAVNFFYRVGDRVDRFLVRRLDTAYIQLPEHSWRLALNTAVVGVNSTITSTTESIGDISLHNRLKPGVNLGFFAGYRSLGFGYSWDLRNAYSRQLNFSLGSKFIGIDFSLQKSANTNTSLQIGEYIGDIASNNVAVTNANLTFWYAVNYPRYSHQAAIKQSYMMVMKFQLKLMKNYLKAVVYHIQ